MLRSIFQKNKVSVYEPIEIEDNKSNDKSSNTWIELMNLIDYQSLSKYDTVLNTELMKRLGTANVYQIEECYTIMSRMNLKGENPLNKCYFCYNIINIFIQSEQISLIYVSEFLNRQLIRITRDKKLINELYPM
jgi:hypothetical protein